MQFVAHGTALAFITAAAGSSSAPADPEPATTPARRIVVTLADLDGAVMLD